MTLILALSTTILLVLLPFSDAFVSTAGISFQLNSLVKINTVPKTFLGNNNNNNDRSSSTSSSSVRTFLLAKPRPIELMNLNDIEAFEKELLQLESDQQTNKELSYSDDDLDDDDDDDDYFNTLLVDTQQSDNTDFIRKLTNRQLISSHTIPDSLHTSRIDSALASLFASFQLPIGISRSQAIEIVEIGCVSINTKVITRKSSRVQCGQLLSIDWKKIFTNKLLGDEYSFTTNYEIIPENIPLTILYEDDSILVINKQADMVVHPAAGNWNGTIVNAVAYYLQNQSPYRPSELYNTKTNSIIKVCTPVIIEEDKETDNNNFAASTVHIPIETKSSEHDNNIIDHDSSNEDNRSSSSPSPSSVAAVLDSVKDHNDTDDTDDDYDDNDDDTVLDLIRQLMEKQKQVQDESSFRPGIIHRLDKGTTGVMVIGKSAYAVRHISNQFATRSKIVVAPSDTVDTSESLRNTIEMLLHDDNLPTLATTPTTSTSSTSATTPVQKIYLACTIGKHPSNNVILNKRIRRHRTNRQQMCVVHSHSVDDDVYHDIDVSTSGKEALSIVDTIEYNTKHQIGFVQVQIYTGRTHQIRVHLQDYGTPIIGDDLYGNKVYNERYFYNVDAVAKSTSTAGSTATTTTTRIARKLTKIQRQEKKRINRSNRRPYLHAHQLTILHPITNQIMTFVAPLPNDMKQFITKYSLLSTSINE